MFKRNKNRSEEGNIKFLLWVEKVGNRLPHPITLFIIVTAFVLIAAEVLQGFTVNIPGANDTSTVNSLLNVEGARWLVQEMLFNFIEFPPFRAVIVTMLGVAVAEHTGLFEALSKRVLLNINHKLVTAGVLFAGVMSSLASDAGIVFMPALAAAVFASVGRNPIVGVAVGYASACSGYFANLSVTSQDATLAGITDAAINIVPATEGAATHIGLTWFISIAGVFLLVPLGTWVTHKFVEPRFKNVEYEKNVEHEDFSLSKEENRGLKVAGITLLVYLGIIAVLTIPSGSLLRDPETNEILLAQFEPVIPVIAFAFFITGLVYGIVARKIKNDKDVANLMSKGMGTLSGFLVIAFAAAQLIAIFGETNLATIVAIQGAGLIQNIGVGNVFLIIMYMLFLGFINLFLYSGTSKWALLAPVFVPLFGLLDFSPAFSLALYRISDSATNAISPLFPYLPIVLGLVMRYQKNAGIGTVLTLMIPYSVAFLIGGIILSIIWYLLGLPLGPGSPLYLE